MIFFPLFPESIRIYPWNYFWGSMCCLQTGGFIVRGAYTLEALISGLSGIFLKKSNSFCISFFTDCHQNVQLNNPPLAETNMVILLDLAYRYTYIILKNGIILKWYHIKNYASFRHFYILFIFANSLFYSTTQLEESLHFVGI